MFLSPVVVALMIFIGGLFAIFGIYVVRSLVSRLIAAAPVSERVGDLTYSKLSE